MQVTAKTTASIVVSVYPLRASFKQIIVCVMIRVSSGEQSKSISNSWEVYLKTIIWFAQAHNAENPLT